ncbi:helix-turn-helix transcriptional regulator [Desulfosporosinus sp. SB140]|uniref:helix-turn-helix transcriptional regulator n=1 Tax=Desulfosporosinus paludis TaxID=3115649 RepID=UPI00388F502D
MKLSKEKIISLTQQQGLSQNALADQIGVQRGTLSNALNGKRGAGRTLLAKLLRAFPNETAASLTVKERK